MDRIAEYKKLLNTCMNAGLKIIGVDLAARILSVVHLCSNNELFVYDEKLRADLDFICKFYHIGGAETPNVEIVELVKKYSAEIEKHFEKIDSGDGLLTKKEDKYPQWCIDLMKKRYNINLFQ